jgi:hypothetical protein
MAKGKPSNYKLYGARRAGSTVEKGEYVDKGVRNSGSLIFPIL